LTGQESRQQLYTMLTRGRAANHLYLQVVGDGDPHTVLRPETICPRTPTETLQQILARDEAPISASTLLRELNNPAARLFQAGTHRTQSRPRQATPVPKTRTASEQATRTQPIAHSSSHIALPGTCGCTRAAMAGQAAHCRIWLFLSDQAPGSPGRRVSSLRCGPRRRNGENRLLSDLSRLPTGALASSSIEVATVSRSKSGSTNSMPT